MTAEQIRTLAALAADVESGEMSLAKALGAAYALGHASGLAMQAENVADRIVRVGGTHEPEVRTDAH